MALRRSFPVSPFLRSRCTAPLSKSVFTWSNTLTTVKERPTPILRSLPPPASQHAPEIDLHRRAVLISGIQCKKWNVSNILAKVRGGALEFARYQPGWGGLTLSFLLSHSADEFVRTTLSNPKALHGFAQHDQARWEWLPSVPLAPSIAGLSRNDPRRALFLDFQSRPGYKYWMPLRRFGELEFVKQLDKRQAIVQYYEIADAIRAHDELQSDKRVKVDYYADWCEMTDQQRGHVLGRLIQLQREKRERKISNPPSADEPVKEDELVKHDETIREDETVKEDESETATSAPPADGPAEPMKAAEPMKEDGPVKEKETETAKSVPPVDNSSSAEPQPPRPEA
ncbi:hypothetical protein FB45DRAFT_894728 [Roridomyces roridus]|uniref:Uncharacterized protein n=1 Tax=Roridomyces roridus TaxID=1738132 RepID=A0AAD7CGH5_9AGAR|nr:hypothetical protein FB45DRAFT_894728 [Roridomyces roridus]